MKQIVLLGPQRLQPTVGAVVDSLGLQGRIAAVTAGWQEREAEDDELRQQLGHRTVNLRLHQRGDAVFAEDPELFAAHRRRQDRLKELQQLYRLRLEPALEVARELMRKAADSELASAELDAALESVRSLDAHHLERLRAIHQQFEADHQPAERPAVLTRRQELADELEGVSALAIAGGHLPVLLNRMRLFDLLGLLDGQPIVAWSAGAMILAERVVVFHDSPPQGAGAAQVLEVGLARAPELLPLPHARRRLRLDDPGRVAMFSRRFAPLQCLAMNEGAELIWDGRRWAGFRNLLLLTPGGDVVPAREAEREPR